MYDTSLNRISGLASGMDTDSLVKKLMTAESASLNKMKQNQQKYQWQSDGYRQWNSDLFSFYTTTLFNMKMSGKYGTFNVSSSNSDAISGTATADAVPGTYTFEVDHLAQSATMVSNLGSGFKQNEQLGYTATLQLTTVDHTGTTDGTHTATVTIAATDKIGDVVSKINSLKDSSGNSLGIQAIYDDTLKQFILKTKDTGDKTSISISAIDPANNNSPINSDLLDKVLNFSTSASATTTVGGTTYNYANGVVYDSSTKAYHTLSLSKYNIDPNNLDSYNDPNDSSIHIYSKNQYIASDVTAQFNGSSITSTSNSVSILGVNYTLKSTTSTVSTITVSRDLDTEVKNITDFINKYNDMLDKLNKAIDEPVYSDYQPLTDDQRSAMTDTQIQQWETKAKSGLFHNDSILTGLVNNLRNHMTSFVGNGSKYNSLASIGIESSSYEDKGKLYVDETKLRAALQDDPDAIKSLFQQDHTNAKNGQRGLIPQIYDDVKNAVQQLTNKAGKTGNSQYDQSVVGKLLTNLNTQIYNEQQRLNDKENQYYKEFTAMETAMSQYNSQSAWLSQQFASNG
jgi:flagellar hook-associated protein 2